MPSPQSGTACNLVSPAAPRKALDADDAVSGDADTGKSGSQQSANGKNGAADSPVHKPGGGGNGADGSDDSRKKVWIEIELVDTKNKPVPGEAYSITLPDGTVAGGTLDENGFAHVDGIDPGSCKITFPNLEKKAWKPK